MVGTIKKVSIRKPPTHGANTCLVGGTVERVVGIEITGMRDRSLLSRSSWRQPSVIRHRTPITCSNRTPSNPIPNNLTPGNRIPSNHIPHTDMCRHQCLPITYVDVGALSRLLTINHYKRVPRQRRGLTRKEEYCGLSGTARSKPHPARHGHPGTGSRSPGFVNAGRPSRCSSYWSKPDGRVRWRQGWEASDLNRKSRKSRKSSGASA